MKAFKKLCLSLLLCVVLATGGFMIWVSQHYVVPIVMYHHVQETDEPRPNFVSPETFEYQMAYLSNHGYNVISLDELVKAKLQKRKLPRKTVVLTFDDAYANNYTEAYPIMKKYGFGATIFVPTNSVGTEGYLTWSQMKEMLRNNVSFGSHTMDHGYLPDLSLEEASKEVFESKHVLEQHLNVAVDYFAFPTGGFSEAVKGLIKKAGYKGAVATKRGYDKMNYDVFELNRVRFSEKDNRDDYLWIKLSGYYNLFRKPKKPN